MALAKQAITPCLWFDTQAEDAAKLYCAVFPNSKITDVSRFPDAGVVAFELDSQPFTALNGGPQFSHSEAVSFQIMCETQSDVDHYWDKLTENGGQEGPCGWLKDKFGLSWQVVPASIPRMMSDPDPQKPARVMNAFMQMKKMDIAALEKAYRGE